MNRKLYQNINATIQRGIQKSLVEINKALLGITKEAASGIAKEIEQAWRDMAAQNLSGRDKHLQNYLEGIQPVAVENGKIVFKISGYKSLMVERGWAPPGQVGAAPEDGYGQYDGKPHDMRPFLLHGTDKWDGIAGKGPQHSGDGFAYKVISMPFEGATEAGLTEATRNYLQGKVDQGAMTSGKAESLAKKFNTALRKTHRVADSRRKSARANPPDDPNKPINAGLAGKGTSGIPASKTILWSETMKDPQEIQHRNFLYKSMRVTAHGQKRYTYHLLRTISDNPKQADLWFAVGVKPVNLLSDENGIPGPMLDKAAEILIARGIEASFRKLNGKVFKETVK